jgi:WD40 repeat protein
MSDDGQRKRALLDNSQPPSKKVEDGSPSERSAPSDVVLFGNQPVGVCTAFLSLDGLVALSSSLNGIRVYEFDSRQCIAYEPVVGGVHCCRCSPCGKIFAIGLNRSWDNVALLRLDDRQFVSPFWSAHSMTVYCVDFSSDGTVLGTSGADSMVHFWDTSNRRQLLSVNCNGHVFAVRFAHHDPTLAVTASSDGRVRLIDLGRPGGVFLERQIHSRIAYCATFSPSGRTICTTGALGQVAVLSAADLSTLFLFTLDQLPHVFCAVFSRADERLAVVSSSDGALWLLDVESGQLVERRALHADECFTVDVHPDGRRMISASADGKLATSEVPSEYIPTASALPAAAPAAAVAAAAAAAAATAASPVDVREDAAVHSRAVQSVPWRRAYRFTHRMLRPQPLPCPPSSTEDDSEPDCDVDCD